VLQFIDLKFLISSPKIDPIVTVFLHNLLVDRLQSMSPSAQYAGISHSVDVCMCCGLSIGMKGHWTDGFKQFTVQLWEQLLSLLR
jgi:hypothetical protein